MPHNAPKTAMLLCAGLATRMRPITDTMPKCLVKVAGRSMLDRVLDHLERAGVTHIVVNLHWHGDQIKAHLANEKRFEIAFSPEPELLDTGYGTKVALPLLGDAPFYSINTDMIWFDGAESALLRLAARWDAAKMDALMLMMPTERALGVDSTGDFFLHSGGESDERPLYRANTVPPRPYIWMAVQIMTPRIYANTPDAPFSNNLVWHRAEAEGRLFGLIHDGSCYHVGTPADLEKANIALKGR